MSRVCGKYFFGVVGSCKSTTACSVLTYYRMDRLSRSGNTCEHALRSYSTVCGKMCLRSRASGTSRRKHQQRLHRLTLHTALAMSERLVICRITFVGSSLPTRTNAQYYGPNTVSVITQSRSCDQHRRRRPVRAAPERGTRAIATVDAAIRQVEKHVLEVEFAAMQAVDGGGDVGTLRNQSVCRLVSPWCAIAS